MRVGWSDCCLLKLVGGFALVDPIEALHALLTKWVLKALLPSSSNLQILLRRELL